MREKQPNMWGSSGGKGQKAASGTWASERRFRYLRCRHGRDSVQLARATRIHAPMMYMDTREQLSVRNNHICGAAVVAQAKKQHLGHGHLSTDFGI